MNSIKDEKSKKSAKDAMLKVVLVGPTNVGKSTLFNKLTHSRDAIVCNRPGVTVDRHEKTIQHEKWGGVQIVDTGGIGLSLEGSPLKTEIERAAFEAMDSADVICFVVDGFREPGVEEYDIASMIRKRKSLAKTPVILVVNKSDSKKFDLMSQYALGFEHNVPVSAEHGLGIDELWEKISELTDLKPQDSSLAEFLENESESDLENEPEEKSDENPEDFRVIVLGRPNVGKSTLLNSLLGEERHIVSSVSGTTRDVIVSQMKYGRRKWTLLDTAGMRRPGRLERDVEWVAREKLKEAAHQSDVAILVVDATEGLSDLDSAIAGLALDFGLSLVIALNKWDQVHGEAAHDLISKIERTMAVKFGSFEWCPVVQISALTGKGLKELLKIIDKIKVLRTQRVQTATLNQVFERKIKHHPHPASLYGKMPKFYYASQVKVSPPEFVVFSNVPSEFVHPSYKRYVENTFRKEFEFIGTPIKLHFKTKNASDSRSASS